MKDFFATINKEYVYLSDFGIHFRLKHLQTTQTTVLVACHRRSTQRGRVVARTVHRGRCKFVLGLELQCAPLLRQAVRHRLCKCHCAVRRAAAHGSPSWPPPWCTFAQNSQRRRKDWLAKNGQSATTVGWRGCRCVPRDLRTLPTWLPLHAPPQPAATRTSKGATNSDHNNNRQTRFAG